MDRACVFCDGPLTRKDFVGCRECRELLRGLLFCARCDYQLDVHGAELCGLCCLELEPDILAGAGYRDLVAIQRGRIPIRCQADELGDFLAWVLFKRPLRLKAPLEPAA